MIVITLAILISSTVDCFSTRTNSQSRTPEFVPKFPQCLEGTVYKDTSCRTKDTSLSGHLSSCESTQLQGETLDYLARTQHLDYSDDPVKYEFLWFLGGHKCNMKYTYKYLTVATVGKCQVVVDDFNQPSFSILISRSVDCPSIPINVSANALAITFIVLFALLCCCVMAYGAFNAFRMKNMGGNRAQMLN
jgi:hypothetical protein